MKSKAIQIPEGYTAADIKLESSTCTGEKTIGFYDRHDKKLHFSELVRTERDIREFYLKYGVAYPQKT